jgi:hypothetical protein
MFPKKVNCSFMINLSLTKRESNDHEDYILQIVRQKEKELALKVFLSAFSRTV